MSRKVLIALRMSGIAGQDKFSGIFRHLGDRHDWDVELVRTAEEFTPERVRRALRRRYDGYIVSIPGTEASALPLAGTDAPTVVMDLYDPGLSARRKNIVFIRNSAQDIGTTAADHLVATGRCRSYAFVHNPTLVAWSTDRCRAFRETLRDRGFSCHELADARGLVGLERPIGVFAANDDTGFAVLEHCRARRWRVPADVLVLGINNDTLICEHCRPQLSSIQPDFEQEGFLAAQVLDEMMRAGAETGARTLYVGVRNVVRRDSTAETSNAGKLVQQAMAYIRRNALRGIGVGDVAQHLGCSRRLADLRFRELQGTTIGETIIAVRLNEVRRLLTTTHETIEAITHACGYESPNYLKNLFKRRFGLTMRDFRQTYRSGPS
ncbi:MAG: substrate-binding domain-containing protein [Kiritimatiellia bacterium]